MKGFTDRLAQLRGAKCEGVEAQEHETESETFVRFTDGTRLKAGFWRLSRGGRPVLSIFDHRQQYGLPATH